MKGWQKPRIRVKPGGKFGVVERLEMQHDSRIWVCGCGSSCYRLLEDGRIACQGCNRLHHGAWIK